MDPRNYRFVVCAIVMGAISCASCLSTPVTHPDPRHATVEVAHLRAVRGKIIAVDGIERYESSVELPPGDHEIDVTYLVRGDELAPNVREEDVARIECRCQVTLMAGGRYRLELARATAVEQRSALVTRYVHRPRLRDATDGRNLFLDSICNWR